MDRTSPKLETLVDAVRRDETNPDVERGCRFKHTRSDTESRINYLSAFNDAVRLEKRIGGLQEGNESHRRVVRESSAGADDGPVHAVDAGVGEGGDRSPRSVLG